MSKFNVGDRVVVIHYPSDKYTPVGAEGTIVEFTTYINVKLDDPGLSGISLFLEEELQLIQEEEFVHSYNRHSDAICNVMENYDVGRWWNDIRDHTQNSIPFPYGNNDDVVTNRDLKEIFFTLMWIVDDETLDEIIKELKA